MYSSHNLLSYLHTWSLLCILVGEHPFLHCWYCPHINWYQIMAIIASRSSHIKGFYRLPFIRSNTIRLLTIKALDLASLRISTSYAPLDLLSSTSFKFMKLCIWSNWYPFFLSTRITSLLDSSSTQYHINLPSRVISFFMPYGLLC